MASLCAKSTAGRGPSTAAMRAEHSVFSPCSTSRSCVVLTRRNDRAVVTSAVLDPAITSPFKNFQGPGWAQGLNAPVKITPKPQDTADRLRAEQAKYLMRRVAQLEAALSEAVSQARMNAQVASETACMNTALRHTNFNLNQQIREGQKERIQLNIRIHKLKEAGSKAFDGNHDPAIERAAISIVKSEEFTAMQQQLMTMQQEMVKLQAEVEAQRRRADECLAQSTKGSSSNTKA